MSLDRQITELSHLHPWKSASLVALEHAHLSTHYGCAPEIATEFLRYNYTTPKPKTFLLWYVDHYAVKRELVEQMCNPRSSINQDPHTLYRPDMTKPASPDNPHKFP